MGKRGGHHRGENGGRTNGDGMLVDAAEADGSQALAGSADKPEDNEAELVEEEMLGPGIDEGIAESINKLPSADQEKLKAALGARGGRKKPLDGEQGKVA